mgnify:FL=1
MTDYHFKKFLDLVEPNIEFDHNEAASRPDYSNLTNWAATPESDVQQFYIPDESFQVNKINNDVDVFYIHPTGFYEKNWNSDMDRNKSAFERTEIMLANQASAFNESCNIYAPEYRQATYFAFFDKNQNGKKALDLAYTDVESAFDYFIENNNNDKPFIVAGHSQGALHAQRLIINRIQGTSLQERFICAYAIGYMIPDNLYDSLFPFIKRSENYNDTNCIVSWSTVVEGFKRSREKTPFWTPNGWTSEPMVQKIVSTNPFSWTNDSDWHLSPQNKSIINKSQDYDFTDQISIAHTGTKKSIGLTRVQEFSASLNDKSGLVETRGPLIDNIKKMKFFSGDLHSFDMMLFWGTLRQNVKDRIKTFV